jgi:hypothetical protein
MLTLSKLYQLKKALTLTQDDINLPMDNYDNIAMWKEKVPTRKLDSKGFGIVTLLMLLIKLVSNLKVVFEVRTVNQ